MTPASSDTRIAGSKVKGLNCPNCGAAMNIRGFEHTVSVVCPQCLSILDARDQNLKILQKFTDKTRIKILLPLGSRGNRATYSILFGALYAAICVLQWAISASGGTAMPWLQTTMASTDSPQYSSGIPITAASLTSVWLMSASSTSRL